MSSYLSNHNITTFYGDCVVQCNQAAVRLFCERCKRALDLPIFFDRNWAYIDFGPFGSSPYRLKKQICIRITPPG